jgi:DNA-binding NarL/FixJ family response regulator
VENAARAPTISVHAIAYGKPAALTGWPVFGLRYTRISVVFDPRVHATLVAATAQAAVPLGGTSATPGQEAAARPPDPPDGLTQREVEILSLIAQGLTNGEIADRLFLSNHAVKTHINRIFAKTGSRDRVAALGYAQRHHIG